MTRGRQTLRPDKVIDLARSGLTMEAVGAGTYLAALTDNSDASYVRPPSGWDRLAGIAFEVPEAALATTERLHRARVRGRIAFDPSTYAPLSITGWFAPATSRPPAVDPDTIVDFHYASNIIADKSTGWTYHPHTSYPDGALAVSQRFTDLDGEVVWDWQSWYSRARLYELYVDLDVLAVPDVDTILVINDAGADTATVTDTSQPTIRAEVDPGFAVGSGVRPNGRTQVRVVRASDGITTGNVWTSVGEAAAVYDRTETYGTAGATSTVITVDLGEVSEPLTNDLYVAYVRTGTDGWTDGTWWSPTTSRSFTMDVPVPAAPALTIVEAPDHLPPRVDATGTVVASTETWDAAPRLRLEVSYDAGATWQLVTSTGNGAAADGPTAGSSATVADRFVSRHTQPHYRGQWYGYSNGLVVASGWSEVVAAAPHVGPCDAHLVHPSDPTLDWSGPDGAPPWKVSRPFGTSYPLVGGFPTVASGGQGGRDYGVELSPLPADLLRLTEQLLASALLWYVPSDPDLPATWVSPSPVAVTPTRVGYRRVVAVTLVTVGEGEPTVLPEAVAV